jgi:hypothetical protein
MVDFLARMSVSILQSRDARHCSGSNPMKAKQIWITLHHPDEADFADVDLMMREHNYVPIDEDEGWVEDKGLWQCSFEPDLVESEGTAEDGGRDD